MILLYDHELESLKIYKEYDMKMERCVFELTPNFSLELPIANCPNCSVKFAVLGVFETSPTREETHLNYCYRCGTMTTEFAHFEGRVADMYKKIEDSSD